MFDGDGDDDDDGDNAVCANFAGVRLLPLVVAAFLAASESINA